MIDNLFRPAFDKAFIVPVVAKLERIAWVSPNRLTFAALLTGMLTIPLLAMHWSWFAIFVLAASGYLDNLDGGFARYLEMSDPKGAVFDIISDRIVEFSVIMGLYLYDPSRAFLCIMMLGSSLVCVTSFLIVGMFSENRSDKSFHYSPGLMERTEAFVAFGLMMLFPSYFHLLAWSFVTLVFVTAAIRVFQYELNV